MALGLSLASGSLSQETMKDIYIRAITDTFGSVPYAVANDGDVSALAGAMSLEEDNVLGIAMGTSEAVGYVGPAAAHA